MSNAEVTAPKQRRVIGVPFAPGQSGNPAGRPKGARSKFSELFISDLHTVWETHGLAALEKCAVDEPGQFLRVCAMLMPKDISVTFGVNPAEFVKTFRDVRTALGNEPQPRLRRSLRTIATQVIEHDDAG
jgi:Family of unknown function (DUF5681)